jgi:hypothetical protein
MSLWQVKNPTVSDTDHLAATSCVFKESQTHCATQEKNQHRLQQQQEDSTDFHLCFSPEWQNEEAQQHKK